MEYWNHRLVNLSNRGEVKESLLGLSCCLTETTANFGTNLTTQDPDTLSIGGHNSADEQVQHVLQGLFKKASPEELQIMHRIFCSKVQGAEWRLAFATLMEEIQKTSR